MSKNYDKVKSFYAAKLWSLTAVDKWITADKFQEITGEKYVKK
ncbi:XkdX family protein [Lacrimispora algidixylanolytica]|nr:XkdX family protein [Lacrimispora algidixylanolytica]